MGDLSDQARQATEKQGGGQSGSGSVPGGDPGTGDYRQDTSGQQPNPGSPTGGWGSGAGAGYAPTSPQPPPAPGGYAGQPLGKKRNPIGVVVLSFITIGIYALYWYGTINAEMRRHDPRIKVTPVLAVLAQFVPIVNLVSGYNTAERVKRLEMADGMHSQISPVLSVLFMIFLGIGYPIQVQSHLNAQWDHHLMGLGLK